MNITDVIWLYLIVNFSITLLFTVRYGKQDGCSVLPITMLFGLPILLLILIELIPIRKLYLRTKILLRWKWGFEETLGLMILGLAAIFVTIVTLLILNFFF